ncbi:hypothetical protein P9112_011898 [Eukaryota sp. TZLM1-RC]
MGNCSSTPSKESSVLDDDIIDALPGDFSDGEERFLEEEAPEDASEENFLAIRPWIGPMKGSTPAEFKDPENWPENAPPSKELMLDYIYGVTTQGIRSMVHFIDDDRIVYPAAGVGVVLSLSSNFQNFFRGHNNDIMSLAISPDRSLVATGQVRSKNDKFARVCVWDPDSLKEVCSFTSLERGVVTLAFDTSGKKVLAVGNDDYHSIAVYDVSQGTQLSIQRGERNKAYELVAFGENQFLLSGHNYARILTIENDGSVSIRKVVFGGSSGRFDVTPNPCCASLPDQRLVMGTSKGQLYVLNSNVVTHAYDVHKGPVLCLHADSHGVITSGRDCTVKLFSADFKEVSSITLPAPCRSITRLPSATSLTTGLCFTCENGAIYYYEFAEQPNPKTLVHCHGKLPTPAKKTLSEAWGMDVHPSEPWVFSAGDCGQLIKYCTEERKTMSSIILPNVCRSVAVSPDGNEVACGLADGTLVVSDCKDLSLKKTIKLNSKKPTSNELSKMFADVGISDLKFSPDGSMLAAASHDQLIYVLDSNYQVLHSLSGHTAHVRSLDWDTSSNYIQSICGGYDYLFWNAKTGDQVTSASFFADKDWFSWSLVVGWPVQGIFKAAQKGTDINTVAKSHQSDLIVTGTDDGTVELFNYPVLHECQERKMNFGHSAHLTRVCFSPDDDYVYSLGGRDCCLCQWMVVSPEELE